MAAPRKKTTDSRTKKAGISAPKPAAPANLDACRREIDKLDTALIELLDHRGAVARRIGEIKRKQGKVSFDAGRHLEKLNAIAKRGSGVFPIEGLRLVFGEIMSACLALQGPQQIAYLGPEATFSHIAAVRAFGRSIEYKPYGSIHDIFEAVEKSWVNFGIVPIENSTGGVIHTTLDELMTSPLSICAEIHIAVHHHMMAMGRLEDVKKVCTHPQILSQCRNWLRAHLPNAIQIETGSSGEGAKLALKDKSIATIGSELASKIYGLPIVMSRIEDVKENITRFLIVGHQSPGPSGNDKTSIMFCIKDEPGALKQLLAPFSDRGINLTKIESRPSRRRAWDYNFFVDMNGHMTDAKIVEALEAMRPYVTYLRVLGSYPVDNFITG
ncbi:prephenate dehydratase [bacterium]|nr:prephenate dehydratase [bacterium]